eukprot:scaffold3319_cov427-Prasinococcus_capsulatus_cf.AAC.16
MLGWVGRYLRSGSSLPTSRVAGRPGAYWLTPQCSGRARQSVRQGRETQRRYSVSGSPHLLGLPGRWASEGPSWRC